ncbi:hypothetical protein [Candidatus Nitrospira bockiana]
MANWADTTAEAIVDAFTADSGPEDLLRLQHAIAAALRDAREAGKKGTAGPGAPCKESDA